MAAAMLIAATAMKFIGAATQGEAEGSAMNRAGDVAAANARNTQLQSSAKEDTQRRHQALQMGNIRASAAESGFDPSSGSMAGLQVKSAQEMELDALTTRYEGVLQATNFKNEEAGYRVAAKNARRSGYLNAFGSLAQGAAMGYGMGGAGGSSGAGTITGGSGLKISGASGSGLKMGGG